MLSCRVTSLVPRDPGAPLDTRRPCAAPYALVGYGARVDASCVSRRALLGATATTTAALALTACGGSTSDPVASSVGAAGDADLAEAAWARENDFRALCLRIRRRHRSLAPRLGVVVAGQLVHEEALAAALPDGERTHVSELVAIPRQPSQAAALVASTAVELQRSSLHDCLQAGSAALARLMASIAASHAVTAEAWRR